MALDGHRRSYRPPFYGIPYALAAAAVGTSTAATLATANAPAVVTLPAAVVTFVLAYYFLRRRA